MRGQESDLRFRDVNTSCVGIGIRRRRVESAEKRKYQLNSLCHSNQQLRWIMSNVLWCSRSHNLATKWLLPLWWLQSLKDNWRIGKHMTAEEAASITFNHKNPFKKQHVSVNSVRFELVPLSVTVCCWVFYNSLIGCAENSHSQSLSLKSQFI